ncbi:MAG: MmgE/PrpD family protein [Hyphomicrobiales bacterium]|nr:MAG: MmgE/PrpD family protein [Hyphomicrobiales bacterium]
MNKQSDIFSQQAESEAPISERLATFAVDLQHDAIPPKVRTRAAHHMLDAAGIALASTRYDCAHKTLAGLQALGNAGDVPVLGLPARMNPRDAATVNGFLCHGLDYDDTHISGIIHPTASVMPAVLSAAAMTGASGREMLTAYVVGIETATRIGACAKSAFHQVGFHPTGIVGIFGCVLAAGRLMGLNVTQLAHAQGLALSMASGSMEFLADGAWNKRFHPGWAASSALTAVSLAREGFVGATKPYDGRFGLFNIYGGKYTDWIDLSGISAGFGSVWELMQTAIKPFPACHFTHAAIDAGLALRDRCPPAQIERIEIRVPQQVFGTICDPVAAKRRPANDYDAKFSVQYLVGTALVHGRLGLAELEQKYLTDPATLALADRTDCAAFGDGPFPAAYSGAVKITLKDGSVHEHSELVNRGAADRPLSNAEIVTKYRANAALWAGPAKVAKMEASVLALDQTPHGPDAFAPFCGA